MSSDASDNPFGDLLTNLTNNVTDQEQREKMEDYAVMAGSLIAAEAVPGLGEVQLGIQFLDFIDPFGYNQALNRKSVNDLLSTQYQKIQDMQTAVGDCYSSQGADTDSCTKAGIGPDAMATFLSYSPNVQEKLLKTSTSWLSPIDPIVKWTDALQCTLATRPEFIRNNCHNPDYAGFYMDFWDKNVAAYQQNAAAAEQQAAQQAAASLYGDTTQDDSNFKNKKKIQLMMAATFIILVVIIFLVVSKLTKSLRLP